MIITVKSCIDNSKRSFQQEMYQTVATWFTSKKVNDEIEIETTELDIPELLLLYFIEKKAISSDPIIDQQKQQSYIIWDVGFCS